MMDIVVLVIGQMGGIVDGYSGFNDRWWVV